MSHPSVSAASAPACRTPIPLAAFPSGWVEDNDSGLRRGSGVWLFQDTTLTYRTRRISVSLWRWPVRAYAARQMAEALIEARAEAPRRPIAPVRHLGDAAALWVDPPAVTTDLALLYPYMTHPALRTGRRYGSVQVESSRDETRLALHLGRAILASPCP